MVSGGRYGDPRSHEQEHTFYSKACLYPSPLATYHMLNLDRYRGRHGKEWYLRNVVLCRLLGLFGYFFHLWFAHLYFGLGRGPITHPCPAMVLMDRKDQNSNKTSIPSLWQPGSTMKCVSWMGCYFSSTFYRAKFISSRNKLEKYDSKKDDTWFWHRKMAGQSGPLLVYFHNFIERLLSSKILHSLTSALF